MYKTHFPNYGSNTIVIEIRSREHFAQHFKVVGHWKKDQSDKEEIVKTSKSQAEMICQMMNAGHSDVSEVLKALEQQNNVLKEQIEIIADVNWRTGFGWKVAAFIAGAITGVGAIVFINQSLY